MPHAALCACENINPKRSDAEDTKCHVTKRQREIPRPKIQAKDYTDREVKEGLGVKEEVRGGCTVGQGRWVISVMAILVHFVPEYRIRPPFQDWRLFRRVRKAIASLLLSLHHPFPPKSYSPHPFSPSPQRQAKLKARAIIRGHWEVYKPPGGRGPDAASHSLLFFELLKLHKHTVSTW